MGKSLKSTTSTTKRKQADRNQAIVATLCTDCFWTITKEGTVEITMDVGSVQKRDHIEGLGAIYGVSIFREGAGNTGSGQVCSEGVLVIVCRGGGV